MNHMHFGRHHGKIHGLTAVMMLTAVMLAVSSGWSPRTLADFNHNAHGVVNYCTIAGGVTTIHGWAHDPDAAAGAKPTVTVTVGTQTTTVNTDVANYHEAAINNYLAANWPGAPTSNTYGWAASFGSLYKGNAYTVSVTANNVGSGESNVIREDNVSQNYDAINVQTLLNSNNTVPDACLNTRPVTPTPPVTPPSTPAPTGGTTSGGTTSHSTSSSKSSGAAAPAAAAGLSSAADGSVAAGTLTAVVTVPADGAANAYVSYGSSPDSLDSSSDSADTTSGNATVEIDNLTPKTDYYYQIIRSDTGGNTSTSAAAGFKTAGYTVSLHFVDAKGKPVGGLDGAINDSDKTSSASNKDGDMTFTGLDSGQYTVTYKYNKLNYKQNFDTDSASDGTDSPDKAIELRDTVNVSKLTNGSTAGYTGPKHHSIWGTVILILLFIIVIVGVVLWWLRRRSASLYGPTSYSSFSPDMVDKPTPIMPAVPLPHKAKNEPAPEQLEHVGESLREMVIQSMHEEAQKRKAKNGPPPA